MEHYSKQVNDERLRALFETDVLLRFLDDLADYFTWSENEVFKVSVDIGILSLHLKEIYERLEERFKIYR